MGFILASQSLTLWGDMDKTPYTDTTLARLSGDEQARLWYGAWWIPFIVAALIATIGALPMLMFARRLPGM
jgi:hypothetical protein